MANSTITIPFQFNSFGSVNATTDLRQIWRDRVLMVLLTKFGERVMRPDFGSDLHSVVFENEASAVETATRTINIAFNTWLSPLNLLSITPSFDINTGFLEVSVAYTLPSGDSDVVNVNTAIFSRSGDLIQEITNG